MKAAGLFGGLVALMLSTGLMAEDSDYVNITQDLGTGMALQDVADRAYDNADDYWEDYPGADGVGAGGFGTAITSNWKGLRKAGTASGTVPAAIFYQ